MGRGYLVRRVLVTLPALAVASVFVFALIRVLPGDPADVITSESGNRQAADELRHRFHLDDPLIVQYALWIRELAGGSLGSSLITNQPVAARTLRSAVVTFELSALAVSLSAVLGLTAGVVSAVRRGSWFWDYGLRSVTIIGLAIPTFWAGTLLLLTPSILFNYAPPFRYAQPWDDPSTNIQQMFMPAIAIAVPFSALVARMSRAKMLSVLREDYVRTARAKGLPERTVVFRHALRNGLIEIVTVLGAQFGALLGGAVVVESLFGLPGMGSLFARSVSSRDYPQVQACVVIFTCTILLLNLLIDLLYVQLDPRLR